MPHAHRTSLWRRPWLRHWPPLRPCWHGSPGPLMTSAAAAPPCQRHRPGAMQRGLTVWQWQVLGLQGRAAGVLQLFADYKMCSRCCVHQSAGTKRDPLPTAQDARSLPRRPRLLVCHDMAGGYGADAPVQGCTDCDAFRLLHWHAVDVFVYFSHHLVTLPPPGWVAAGHCHGVPVRCGGHCSLAVGQRADASAGRPSLHGPGAALVVRWY